MITIKDFARDKKISPKAARSRLDRMVKQGLMVRKKGSKAQFVYEKVNPIKIKWHDPFNRCPMGKKIDLSRV